MKYKVQVEEHFIREFIVETDEQPAFAVEEFYARQTKPDETTGSLKFVGWATRNIEKINQD